MKNVNYDKYYSRGKLRDGVMTVSRRSSGFKRECAKYIRTSNHKNAKKVIIDPEADVIWAIDHDSKQFVWNWW